MYTALREAEYRSTAPIAYWNLPPARWLVPRQRRVTEALKVCALFCVFVCGVRALIAGCDQAPPAGCCGA